MPNQTPSNSENAPKAPLASDVKLAQQMQEAAEKMIQEAKPVTSEHSSQVDPETPGSTRVDVDQTPSTMPKNGHENTRRSESTTPTNEPVGVAATAPDDAPHVCAECGTPWGWLKQDPFRPDRWVHEQCAGGYRLQFPIVATAPLVGGYAYSYSVKIDSPDMRESPPDAPRQQIDEE